jgi:hypothetical protein
MSNRKGGVDMPKPKEWRIKQSEEGGAPVIDGTKVVFIDPDDKEVSLDPPAMYGKIISLNRENKTLREKGEAAKSIGDLFSGIDDIPEWKKKADEALTTIENFNEKDWLKADKVEKLKNEMSQSYDQKLANQKASFETALGDKDRVITSKDAQIHKLLVTNNFAVHPLFGGSKPKTMLTPEMAEAYFSQHFKVEVADDGVELLLRAFNDPGKHDDPIYSRENPGEYATFAEAMDELWDRYPGKESLMAAGSPGSGSKGGSGDDDFDGDELKKLKSDYDQAKKNGQPKLAISLKNKIWRMEQDLKRST